MCVKFESTPEFKQAVIDVVQEYCTVQCEEHNHVNNTWATIGTTNNFQVWGVSATEAAHTHPNSDTSIDTANCTGNLANIGTTYLQVTRSYAQWHRLCGRHNNPEGDYLETMGGCASTFNKNNDEYNNHIYTNSNRNCNATNVNNTHCYGMDVGTKTGNPGDSNDTHSHSASVSNIECTGHSHSQANTSGGGTHNHEIYMAPHSHTVENAAHTHTMQETYTVCEIVCVNPVTGEKRIKDSWCKTYICVY